MSTSSAMRFFSATAARKIEASFADPKYLSSAANKQARALALATAKEYAKVCGIDAAAGPNRNYDGRIV